jgi:hypothetical protein
VSSLLPDYLQAWVEHFQIVKTKPAMVDPLFLAEVEGAIAAYERVIGQYASRTRSMIDQHGHIKALSQLVVSPDLQQGFRALRDQGRLDVTFEAIVVRYPQLFEADAVEAAQWRLDNANSLLK